MTAPTVAIVEWLGRGGIAQTAEAWALELGERGYPVVVVSRTGRELAGPGYEVVGSRAGGSRLRAHVEVARAAVRVIRERRPEVVVVQGSIVPILERRVFAAAAAVGTRTVLVVHNHRPHSLVAGTSAGQRFLVRSATTVVTHTNFVADRLRGADRHPDVRVLPHPVQVGMLRAPAAPSPLGNADDDRLLALHFGVVARGYKGTAVVADLAADPGLSGWRFAVIGRGAPPSACIETVDRFVTAGELLAALERSDATVLPYRDATQSGAVVLAQLSGSVVVATAVGGIPEQVRDGETGVLVRGQGDREAWCDALARLADPATRSAMATAAKAYVWAGHERFVGGITRIVDGE